MSSPWVKGSLYLLVDLFCLILGHFVATHIATGFFAVPMSAIDPTGSWVFLGPLFPIVLYLLDGYKRADLRSPERELEISFKAVFLSFVFFMAADLFILKAAVLSRYLLVLWFFLLLIFLPIGRLFIASVYDRLCKRGIGRSRVITIGSCDTVLRYRRLLLLQRHNRYEIVGVVLPQYSDMTTVDLEGLICLGTLEAWQETVRRWQVNLLVLSLGESSLSYPEALEIVGRCKALRVDVDVFADELSQQIAGHEFNYLTGCIRFTSGSSVVYKIQRSAKKCIDIVFGLLGSVLALLLTPVIGLLIQLEDPGPIFYQREYVTCDGNTGHYLKFRTMVRDADQRLKTDRHLRDRFMANYKLRDDPRVLRIGRILRKYSIDEFPQFFSLLCGHLTLVGPRVIAHEEKERYGEFLPIRMAVTPGLTGYWQVMGRQTTTYEDRIQMDKYYIDHWSIWLDLLIIIKTIGRLISPEGAY
jgi:exopolysaccharide biosynthesis polyprenyl glycosylphosphotransferase